MEYYGAVYKSEVIIWMLLWVKLNYAQISTPDGTET